MKVYLMQHGKPVSKEINPGKPLSEEGRRDVEKMASLLQCCIPLPREILHSGKTRAEQTAEIIASKLGPGVNVKKKEGLAPLDDVREIGGTLGQDVWDTIIVGHLPHLARLTSFLTGGDGSHNLVRFQQGGILCLEREDAENWSIGWMVVPEMMHRLAGLGD
ncbi:phosphohistidine phosphatase SixA [Thermodesulfobacteriota bacterium]